jgi:molecular chaperone GrpE (heat shock protein)
MVGITSITLNANAAGSANLQASTEQAGVKADMTKVIHGGQAQASSHDSSASGESDTVKALRKQIEVLQKQLQEQQRQLQQIQASNLSEEARAAAVAVAQAMIASTAGALMSATAALTQVLLEESKSTSGSLVSTQV